MEDMEVASLVDENISQYLNMVSNHAEVAIRQTYGRCVLRTLHQPIDLILNDVNAIIKTLSIVSEDKESSVRASLLAEIPDIAIKCHELANQDVDRLLYDHLLEVLLQFLEDSDSQIRKNSFYAVKHLLEKSTLDEHRILAKICPAIIGLSSLPVKSHDVDYYTNAIELMALLASIIGQSNTEERLLDRFCELCDNEVYLIRRWCADYMPVFCHVLGEKITEERLLPIFKLLCEDNVWGVRKSATKSLPKVAVNCSLESRRNILAPIAYNLLNDGSFFVSVAAFKCLGQLIATFAEPSIVKLEYASSGKLYMTNNGKCNSMDCLFCVEDEIRLLRDPYGKNGKKYTPSAQNPFRAFLTPEPFSCINSTSPSDFINLNKTSFENVHKQVAEDEITNGPPVQPKLPNELLNAVCTTRSSSGCSSASSTDGCDDQENREEVIKFDIGVKDKLTKEKFGHKIKKYEEEDDFYDGYSNDILNTLPDDLREVIAQIRETTHAELRKRHVEFRARVLKIKEFSSNTKTETRWRVVKKENVIAHDINPPLQTHQHHPCVDIGGLTKPLISPWKLRAKMNRQKTAAHLATDSPNAVVPAVDALNNIDTNADAPSKEILPQSDSNYMVIDSTKVTLRKKGKKDNTEVIAVNEEDSDDDEELKEFNALNYWYISPDINIEYELQSLNVDTEVEENPAIRDKMQQNTSYSRFYDLEVPPANDGNDNIHMQKLEKLKALCVGPTQDPQLSYFNQSIVPPYLIEYFVSMEHFSDPDFNMYCVYNFPAVVWTLKKENWNLMYDLLLFLAGDIQWKVRKTIAMFICEIAKIIGRRHSDQDLVPIFLGFFKDLDEVKIEALKNLPTFLTVINRTEHPKIIANLSDCLKCDNVSNWRFREELARQLLHLIKDYGTTYHAEYMIHITGMVIMVLNDKISAVRSVAMDAIAEKLSNSTKNEFHDLAEFLIEDFAHHNHWRRRQMFLNICHEWLSKAKSPEVKVFERYFLPHILELAKDQIPNIRLAVGKLLSLVLFQYIPSKSTKKLDKYSKDDHPVMQTMKMLQNDVDIDVNYVANNR